MTDIKEEFKKSISLEAGYEVEPLSKVAEGYNSKEHLEKGGPGSGPRPGGGKKEAAPKGNDVKGFDEKGNRADLHVPVPGTQEHKDVNTPRMNQFIANAQKEGYVPNKFALEGFTKDQLQQYHDKVASAIKEPSKSFTSKSQAVAASVKISEKASSSGKADATRQAYARILYNL